VPSNRRLFTRTENQKSGNLPCLVASFRLVPQPVSVSCVVPARRAVTLAHKHVPITRSSRVSRAAIRSYKISIAFFGGPKPRILTGCGKNEFALLTSLSPLRSLKPHQRRAEKTISQAVPLITLSISSGAGRYLFTRRADHYQRFVSLMFFQSPLPALSNSLFWVRLDKSN
jgi:hypothetical protein